MHFVFDERKSAQVAAFLLALHDAPLPTLTLLDLLYLADRRSLVETGYPLTGDLMVSTDQGPMLSTLAGHAAWGCEAGTAWREYVSAPSDFMVHLLQPAPVDLLSEYEEGILRDTHAQFAGFDGSALRAYMRGLPEWLDPHGTAPPVDVRAILRDAGMSDEEIREVALQAGGIRALHALRALPG